MARACFFSLGIFSFILVLVCCSCSSISLESTSENKDLQKRTEEVPAWRYGEAKKQNKSTFTKDFIRVNPNRLSNFLFDSSDPLCFLLAQT